MEFAGLWHITEMEMWDEDSFNMETQAFIRINSNGLGNFQYCLVVGRIDGKVEKSGGKERFVFNWEGHDELDPVTGTGWVRSGMTALYTVRSNAIQEMVRDLKPRKPSDHSCLPSSSVC